MNVVPIGLLLAGVLCGPSLAAGPAKPNLIVIYTDDHGWADLGAQGVQKDIRTPHLDALAAGGVRATNGYVTAPQCVPSRGGLLVGKFQGRFLLDSNGSALDGFNQETTIATRLQNAGYATGMSGKWHLGPPEQISRHGFADVYCNQGASGKAWANFDLEGNTLPGAVVPSPLYHLEANAAAACAFIQRHHDQPFFFYLAFRAPHTPLDCAAEIHLAVPRSDAAAPSTGPGHDLRNRRRRGPRDADPARAQPGGTHAAVLHGRQRGAAQDSQGRLPAQRRRGRLGRLAERTDERRKRHAQRGRHPRSLACTLERHDPRRTSVRASRHQPRRGRHRRRPGGHQDQTGRPRRCESPAALSRRNQDATARRLDVALDRPVRHPRRPVEAPARRRSRVPLRPRGRSGGEAQPRGPAA